MPVMALPCGALSKFTLTTGAPPYVAGITSVPASEEAPAMPVSITPLAEPTVTDCVVKVTS
jgi:hypothetical protein